MESSLSVGSTPASVFEETPYQGILSELRGNVGAAMAAPAVEPQCQQPSDYSSPEQVPNGSGTVTGSENVVWRCYQCHIVNSVCDPDCASCRTKRPPELTLDTVFDYLPSVDDPAKAQLALKFIANNFPLEASADIYMCSVLIKTLLRHGPRLLNIAETGVEALKVVSWTNLSLIELSGGIRVLFSLMGLHATSEKIALHGCSMTERSCLVSETSQNTMREAGGVDGITTALRIHSSNAKIARAACGALYNLAINNAENQSAIIVSGGVCGILCAISECYRDADVARYGRAALDVLLSNTELTAVFANT